MKQAGVVHGAQRVTESHSDFDSLLFGAGAFDLHQAGKRLSANEVAPEADSSLVAVNAIHRDGIRMTHARHCPGFGNNGGVFFLSVETTGQKELERNFALKSYVPGAIDFAETSGIKPLQKLELPPFFGVLCGACRS